MQHDTDPLWSQWLQTEIEPGVSMCVYVPIQISINGMPQHSITINTLS